MFALVFSHCFLDFLLFWRVLLGFSCAVLPVSLLFLSVFDLRALGDGPVRDEPLRVNVVNLKAKISQI